MKPARGEIWTADLDPTIGHEQAGKRPILVVSVDALNRSAADLAIVVPLTSRRRRVRSHVRIAPGDGGVAVESFAKCEDVRSISTQRLDKRFGLVSPETMAAIEDVLRLLLGL